MSKHGFQLCSASHLSSYRNLCLFIAKSIERSIYSFSIQEVKTVVEVYVCVWQNLLASHFTKLRQIKVL